MEKMLAEWQNPAQADKLLQVENELHQVQDIMHKNLKDLLDRGESIEQLQEKSNDLSTVSRDFYKKAKNQNKCCKAT